MSDMGETDFAVIVYREEDQWEADALPATLTADLDGLVHALRRQPSMGGTIGFAGVGDDFWLAVRIIGEDVSLFLSDGPPGARDPEHPGAVGRRSRSGAPGG
jgi:putative tRNA adenosine deaminase-associated protein